MIVVDDLHKSFGPVNALAGVSFTIDDGEIAALIGPNGAGKTTTLRTLCTVMKPSRGCVSVDGFDTVKNSRDVQMRIGVLPDTRGLYPRLTAREHVRYFGNLHSLGGVDLEQRLDGLITTLGMGSFIDARGKGLSKGQTVKVALARALIHDPPNLLLDEPTNGLDVASSRMVRQLIHALRDQGRCVLFSSHIMQEVEALADRLIIICGGRVVADGTPAELRNKTNIDDLEEIFVALTSETSSQA